jgi:hypothetical protein
MLIILASRSDASAAALARRWHEHGAQVVTCEALSRRGWVFDPATPTRGMLVVGDEPVPVRSVRGAVSLLSAVHPCELPHVVAQDREYVASEMMAFLVAWLSSLPCPVLNRPSPLCLAGPHLRREQWLWAATRVGLPARWESTAAHHAGCGAGPDTDGWPTRTVTVVDGRALPGRDVPAHVASAVAVMAAATGASLLTATFVDADGCLEFVGAEPTADVARDDVADAMLAALQAKP